MSIIANTFNEFVLAVKNALGTDEKPINFRAIWQDHDYYFGTYTYATSRFQSMTISSASTNTTYHVLIDSNSVTAHQIATNSDLPKSTDINFTLAPNSYVQPFTHYVAVRHNISGTILSATVISTSSSPMECKVSSTEILVYGMGALSGIIRVVYV